MPTLRDTIQTALTQIDQDAAAAAEQFAAKRKALEQQLAQTEGAFVAVLDTEFEKVKSFFASIGQHLGL